MGAAAARGARARWSGALKVNPDQAVEAIERLQAEAKRLAREVTQLKTKLATGGGGTAEATTTVDVAGMKLVRRKVGGSRQGRAARRRRFAEGEDQVRRRRARPSASDGKVQIVVAVTPDLTSRIKAGQIVKEIAPIVGGGGGGRPDFAEAGGKQPEKIDEMLDGQPRL